MAEQEDGCVVKTYDKATKNEFHLGPDGKIMFTQTQGPREQSMSVTALAAAALCCPKGSEGEAMYKELGSALQSKLAAKTPAQEPTLSPGLAPTPTLSNS